MSTLRELKTRIGSVSSSEKITGAMKMISSAKVHKNEQQLRMLLPFRNRLKSIVGHLLDADATFSSALIEERVDVKHVGLVAFGSDDGLCGAYNINIFKSLLTVIDDVKMKYGKDVRISVFVVGSKLLRAVTKLRSHGIEVVTTEGVDSKMEGDKVSAFTDSLRKRFLSGELDLVSVVYMKFHSISRQKPVSEQLFPVIPSALLDQAADSKSGEESNKPYIFEPNPNSIFNQVLPMYVQSTMQDITVENRASEQAARIMAMQSANDNAKKLLESLHLEYNKLRQQSITTELLDIIGGQVER